MPDLSLAWPLELFLVSSIPRAEHMVTKTCTMSFAIRPCCHIGSIKIGTCCLTQSGDFPATVPKPIYSIFSGVKLSCLHWSHLQKAISILFTAVWTLFWASAPLLFMDQCQMILINMEYLTVCPREILAGEGIELLLIPFVYREIRKGFCTVTHHEHCCFPVAVYVDLWKFFSTDYLIKKTLE